MKISNNGLNVIKKYEGCKLTAYKAVSTEKYYTIGYGHYGSDVKAGMVISQEQADNYLKNDVSNSESAVSSYDSIYHWNQNQFDALVSFTFNCGSGNLKTLLANGTRSIAEISAKIPAYNKSGGKVLQGLVARRATEKELFDASVSQNSVPASASGNEVIRLGQQHSINFTGHTIDTDGIRGPETAKNQIRVLQQALNLDYNAGLKVNGIWNSATERALGRHYVKRGEKQYMVTCAEILCMMHGIDPNGVESPGIFGGGLARAANASKLTYDWFILMIG